MARPQKITDQQLREAQRIFADEPDMIQRVAKYLRLNEKTVRTRLNALEKTVAAPRAVAVVSTVEANVWDVRTTMQKNYERVERLLVQLEEVGVVEIYGDEDGGTTRIVKDHDALIKCLELGRKYSETALKAAEAWYRVEQTKAFMDDVLAVLGEVDPALRDKVMDRFAARRSVRAAFVPH